MDLKELQAARDHDLVVIWLTYYVQNFPGLWVKMFEPREEIHVD